MVRLTRAQAALEAAQAAEIHTDDTAEPIEHENAERAPLSEIEANATEHDTADQETTNTKVKGKKQNKKDNDNPSSNSSNSNTTSREDPVMEEREVTIDDADDDDNDDNDTVDAAEDAPTPVEEDDNRKEQHENVETLQPHIVETVQDAQFVGEESKMQPTLQEPQPEDSQLAESQAEAQPGFLRADFALEGESPSTEPEELILIPKRTPAKNLLAKEVSTMRSTSNKENEQPCAGPARQEPIASASQQFPSRPAATTEDPIDAIDAIDEAIEEVDRSMPKVEPMTPMEELVQESISPVKSPEKAKTPSGRPPTRPSARPSTLGVSATPRVKNANPKPEPAMGRSSSIRTKTLPSKPEPALGRAAPVRAKNPAPKADLTVTSSPKRPLSTRTPLTRLSNVKASPAAKDKNPIMPPTNKEKIPMEIPHSKPRPISLSFPTPPPLAKSTKAPTKSTFQLPGEAIAAKLKAAKEERAKKDQEEGSNASTRATQAKSRPVSMSFPAPPKSTKPLTKSNFQLPGEAVAARLRAAREERTKKEQDEGEKRPVFKARPAPKFSEGPPAVIKQTASSRARESLMLGKSPLDDAAPGTATLKRASSVRDSTTKPRVSVAANRLSTVPQGHRVTSSTSSLNVNKRALITDKPSTSAPTGNKRASMTTTATSAKPRDSSATTTAAQRVTSSGGGTKRGKEVFQRAAAEKSSLDKQKREKGEAAKKARADAAERGRIASREWAEKMKLKSQKTKGSARVLKEIHNDSTAANTTATPAATTV